MKNETTHTTRDGMELKAGVRVFYTGDMANLEREGTVSSVHSDKWGTHVIVELDEIADEYNGQIEEARTAPLMTTSFEPGAGRRFLTVQKRDEERAVRISELEKAYGRRCPDCGRRAGHERTADCIG